MEKNISILLCTYNGETFLKEQIDSIINQSHLNWVLYVSDDGSTDTTLSILQEYQIKLGNDKLKIVSGPRRGFAWNFLNLLYICDDSDYYAFCDQDDVWESDKLQRAISVLDSFSINIPNLYCSRSTLIDENGQEIGYSPLFVKLPGFNNALIQNIAGGNTMVFNLAAKNIITKTPKWKDISYHDWWVYVLISGVGGNLYYDPISYIYYRQHSKNVVGLNQGLKAKLRPLNNILKGNYKRQVEKNIDLLKYLKPCLSIKNQVTLEKFIKIRKSNIVQRIYLMSRLRLYRQSFKATLAFYIFLILSIV